MAFFVWGRICDCTRIFDCLRLGAHHAILNRILAAKEYYMSRSLIVALAAIGFLSACIAEPVSPPPAPIFGGAHSDSIGFTSIGREPY